MKMRRFTMVLIWAVLLMGGYYLQAITTFKFPPKIKYKMLKDNKITASCIFTYDAQTDKKGISRLKMTNFVGLGVNSREWLATYIFAKDSSLYADFVMRGNQLISEVRIIEAIGFDGKKGPFMRYKDLESDEGREMEIFTEYKIVDLLSSFFVISQRVASGKYENHETYGFIIDESIKTVEVFWLGCQKVPFNGRMVHTDTFSLTYQNTEIFQFSIYQDLDGYCFPVNVKIVTDFMGKDRPLELRADKIRKH